MSSSSRPPIFDPERVDAIVFDLDGTLVDSYRAIADSLNHARARFELSPLTLESVRSSVGHGLERLIADRVGADRVAEGVRLFRERYAQVYETGTRLLPGVGATLEELSERGIPLAIASNKPARFTRKIADAFGLTDYLVSVHGPDTVGHTKPHPAMLERCLNDLESTPDRGLYVGDMVLDVETAARAGVAVILIPGGSSPAAELAATGCRVLHSIDELLGILG